MLEVAHAEDLFKAQQGPWNVTCTNRNCKSPAVNHMLTTMAESPGAAGASAEEDLDNDFAGDEDDDELFSEPASLHLPNPWIDNPNPQSKSHPGIGRRLRKFQNRRRRMHRRGETWPYRLYADEPSHILFFEFRGYGPPPDDVGNPGDIYIDLTPHPRPLLYVCHGEKDWKCVNWSSNPNIVEFNIHVHPLLKGRYLWGTASSGFMWFTPATIRYEDLYRYTDAVDYDGMIAKAMKWDFEDDPRGPDNARRREAEESRRRALQDEWLDQHKGWAMSPEEMRREEERKKEKERYAEESRIWREKKILRDKDRPRHDGIIEGQRLASPVVGHLEANLEPVPAEDLSHLPKPAGRTGPRKRHSRSPARGDSVEEGCTHTRQPSIKKPRLETFSPESHQSYPGSIRPAPPESERTNNSPLPKTPLVRGTLHTGNVTQHIPGPPTRQAPPRSTPILAPSLKRKRHSSHGLSEGGFQGNDEGAGESSSPKKKPIEGILSTLKFKKLAKPQENVGPKSAPPRLSQSVTTPTLSASPVLVRRAPPLPLQLGSSLHPSVGTQKRKRPIAREDHGSFNGGNQSARESLLPQKKPKQEVRLIPRFTRSVKPRTGFRGVDELAKQSSLLKEQPRPPAPPRFSRTAEEPSADDHQVNETRFTKLAESGGGGGNSSFKPTITQRKISPEGKSGSGSFDSRETKNAGLSDEGGTRDESERLPGQNDEGESRTEQVQHVIVGAPANRDYDDQEGENVGLGMCCETPCSPVGNYEEETEAEAMVQDDANQATGKSHADADRETPGVTGGGWTSGESHSWLEGRQKEESETEEVIQDEDEEPVDEIYEGPDTDNGEPDARRAWDETRSLSEESHDEIETDDVLNDSVNENGRILADRERENVGLSEGSWPSDGIQRLLETSHGGEIETGDLVNENLVENRQAVHGTRVEGERVKSEFAGGDDRLQLSPIRNLSEETISKEDELEPEDPDIQSEQAAAPAPSVKFQGTTSASQSQQDPGGITDVEAIREIIQKAADGTNANYISKFLDSLPLSSSTVHRFLSGMHNLSADRQTWKERAKQCETSSDLLGLSH